MKLNKSNPSKNCST